MEEMPERPICHVVAWPNGSGKSTFALRYLPEYAGAPDVWERLAADRRQTLEDDLAWIHP